MGKIVDLSGKRFGKLLVNKLAGSSRGGSKLWECICDCGNKKLVTTRHLNRKNNNVRSCGCLNYNKKLGKDSPWFTGYGVISGTFMTRVKKSAKRRSNHLKELLVTIDAQYLDELWHKQKGRCAYTGEKLTLPKKWDDRDYTASLDRKDSSKGYIQGNVQFVTQSVNIMKNKFTHDFFIETCNKIVSYGSIHSYKSGKM